MPATCARTAAACIWRWCRKPSSGSASPTRSASPSCATTRASRSCPRAARTRRRWSRSSTGVRESKPLSHWRAELDRYTVTFGIIARIDELPDDPQYNANGVFRRRGGHAGPAHHRQADPPRRRREAPAGARPSSASTAARSCAASAIRRHVSTHWYATACCANRSPRKNEIGGSRLGTVVRESSLEERCDRVEKRVGFVERHRVAGSRHFDEAAVRNRLCHPRGHRFRQNVADFAAHQQRRHVDVRDQPPTFFRRYSFARVRRIAQRAIVAIREACRRRAASSSTRRDAAVDRPAESDCRRALVHTLRRRSRTRRCERRRPESASDLRRRSPARCPRSRASRAPPDACLHSRSRRGRPSRARATRSCVRPSAFTNASTSATISLVSYAVGRRPLRFAVPALIEREHAIPRRHRRRERIPRSRVAGVAVQQQERRCVRFCRRPVAIVETQAAQLDQFVADGRHDVTAAR